MIGDYDGEQGEEDYEIDVPPVPPAFGTLTEAQLALAELLRVPQEQLDVVAQHSKAAEPGASGDDFVAWIKLLPTDRCNDFLVRLANNEPGLSRLLVKELRRLGRDEIHTATVPEGERVPYATLYAKSKAVRARLEREEQERVQAARQSHLQDYSQSPRHLLATSR